MVDTPFAPAALAAAPRTLGLGLHLVLDPALGQAAAAAEVVRQLARFADLKPMVLICHAPPYQSPLDRIRDGLHAGSRSVAEFVDRYQPEYFLCGHIHEAQGAAAQFGATRAFNVGKQGHLLELD